MESLLLLCALVALSASIGAASSASITASANMTTFGTAIKEGKTTPGVAMTVFEVNEGIPGVVTNHWIAGNGFADSPMTRFVIYIDGETTPSLNYSMKLLCGVGPAQSKDGVPWGHDSFGHLSDAGLYSTLKIPFQKSFRMDLWVPASQPKSAFWFMVRGLHNYPVVLGDLVLPAPVRLIQHALENVTLSPPDYFHLIDVSTGRGLVHSMTMYVTSVAGEYYQEGCVHAEIDGKIVYLSSGLEDIALGAYFHSMANYHTPLAGFALNAESQNSPNSVVLYRNFLTDPVMFSKSISLQWQATDGPPTATCPRTWPPDVNLTQTNSGTDNKEGINQAGPITVTAYTWVYTFDG